MRIGARSPAGCNCLIPCFGQSVAGSLSLRVQQLGVTCETKTRDNVFVTLVVSVQYQVCAGDVRMGLLCCHAWGQGKGRRSGVALCALVVSVQRQVGQALHACCCVCCRGGRASQGRGGMALCACLHGWGCGACSAAVDESKRRVATANVHAARAVR